MKKEEKDDLSFPTKEEMDNLDKSIDKELAKFKTDIESLKILDDVQETPPKPGYMKTKLGPGSEPDDDGLYEVDLDTLLAADLSNCPGTVLPVLIDNTLQTMFAIRDAYKPEKRAISFPWIWIILIVVGLIIVFLVINLVLPALSGVGSGITNMIPGATTT